MTAAQWRQAVSNENQKVTVSHLSLNREHLNSIYNEIHTVAKSNLFLCYSTIKEQFLLMFTLYYVVVVSAMFDSSKENLYLALHVRSQQIVLILKDANRCDGRLLMEATGFPTLIPAASLSQVDTEDLARPAPVKQHRDLGEMSVHFFPHFLLVVILNHIIKMSTPHMLVARKNTI